MDKNFSFMGLISLLLYAVSVFILLYGVAELFKAANGKYLYSDEFAIAMMIGIISNPKTLKFIWNTLFK